MVLLGSLLSPRASLGQLNKEARQIQDQLNHGEIELNLSERCVQEIAQLLAKCGGSDNTSFEDGLATAEALLHLLCNARGKDPPSCLQQALLQSTIGTTLSSLASDAAAAVQRGTLSPQRCLQPLAEVSNTLLDLSGFKYKDGTTGSRVKGHAVLGAAAVPALTSLLFSNSAPGCDEASLLSLKRAAAAALVAFANSVSSCAVLVRTPQIAGGKALTALLEICGDFLLQLDLLDLLYKCARAQGKPDGPTAIPKSPFTAKLIALASSPKDNIDHSAELRALMVAFNRNLGKRAMVASVRASSITIQGIPTPTHPAGNWVDFGQSSMLFSLAAPPSSPGLPDSESDYGASQDAPASDSPPDLVELPYLSFSGVKCFARGEDATLAVTLRDLPEALREGNFPSATEDGNFLLVFSLKIADLAAIHAQAPRVVSAVQAAGISLPQVGGEGDLSQPQHKKKVSIAVFPSRVSNGQRSPRAGSFRPGETVFDQVVRHNQAAAVSVNAAPTGAHTDAASEDHAAQPVAGGAAATNLDFNHKAPKNDAENQNLGQGDGGAGTGTGIGTGGEKRVWKRAPREEAQDEKPAVGGGKKKAPATKQPPGRTTRGVAAAKSKKQATSKPAAQKKGKSKAAVEEADAAAIIEDADPSLSSAPGSKRVGKAVATALNNAPEEEEMFTEGGNGDDSGAMPDWMKDQVAAMEEASPLGALPQGRTALYFDSSDDEDPWLKNPPAPAAPQAAPVPAAKPSAAVKNHHKAAKPASVEEDSDDDWNFSDDDDAVKNKGNCSRQASKKPATQPGKKLAVGGKATGGKSNAKIAPKPRAPKTKVLAKAAPKRAGAKAKPDAPKLAPDQRATRGKAPGKAGAAAGKAGAKQVDLRATSDDEWDQDDAEWSPLDASDYLPLTQAFVNGTDKSPSPTPSLSPPAQPQQAKHGQQRRGRPAPAPALKKLPEAAPAATVKGLKAALARGIKPQQGGNNAQEALLNRAGSEEEQSPPPSSTKRSKAQGRLAAMLGRGRAGAANKATHAPKGNKLSVDCSELFADEEEGDGALPVPQDLTLVPVPGSNKAKKGTPAAAGALLQRTITPATAQGKKQDTGLHAPATGKLVSKMPEAARGAAQAQGPEALQRGKRPAAAAAGAKVRHSLRLAASSSDDEVEDLRDSFDPVEDSEAGDGGDLGMGLSAPPGGRAKRTQAASNLHLSVINAAKGRKAAAEAEERERAVTAAKAPAAGRQRFAAAALKPDDAFAVYLESDSEDEGPGNDATAALVAMLTGGGRAGPKRGRRSQSSCGTDSDDEDSDDDGEGQQLQVAIAQLMAARKKKAAKKEADQQRALAKQLRALLDAARAEVETNTRAIKESAERDCAQASASLHAKMERIKSFIAEFEAGLKSEWEEYLALHAEAEAVAQHAQHEVAEAKAAGKRKLDEVTGEMERRMSTEEKRRKNKAKRAKRVPDLASILVPLLAG